ncbi:MAG: site-2 protease family protein [Planctomycetota bacterium]|nr:site-2 protease family protein [Planctomycetota bacterium]
MLDPGDIAPKRGPEGREWIPFTIVVVVVFGLFAAEIAVDFDLRKYGALMVFVFWIPLLVVHELGHALAAKLVGWRVLELVIGFGKPVKRFRVGGTRVELRTFPLEGFVVPAPRTLRGAPWKNAFVYLAGPGVEIVLILVAGWLVGFDALLSRSDDLGMVTLQSACIAAAIGAAMNLLPFPVAGGLVSDGLGVLLSLLSRPEHYEAALATPYRRRAAAALASGALDAGQAALREGLALHPSNAWLQIEQAVLQAAGGDGKGAQAALERLGSADATDAAAHVTWLHARARIALESLDDDLLVDADAAAEAALKSQSSDVATRITRGATLMERMRYAEASRLLGDAVYDAHDELDRARGLMYVAILEARRGRLDKAQKAMALLHKVEGAARYAERAAAATNEVTL